MKKTLLPVILASLLVISGCNKPSTNTNSGSSSATDTGSSDTNPGTDTGSSDTGSTDTNPGTDTDTGTTPVDDNGFNALVNKLKTTHNYTMDVYSCLEGAEDSEIYTDTFVNINDKAFYSKYYAGNSGYIYQKDQGYVSFLQYMDGTIKPDRFFSTNPNVGISSLYDVVAENLFLGEFVQDANDSTVFYNTNTDAIAVGTNFTGYIETANIVAPEKLIARYDATNEQIIVTVKYNVWYYDEGEQNPEGTATLTIKNIGTSTNSQVEAYIANPTKTYTARTQWSADDKAVFNQYFNGKTPAFLTGSSYALFVSEYLRTGSYCVLVSDYASGDLRTSYGAALEADGFTKGADGKYTLEEKDTAKSQTNTYTIEMAYKSPTDEYNDSYTYGHYYSAGLFQMLLSVKTVQNTPVGTIDTIEALNKYISDNDYNLYVPLLPFGDEVTKVSGFVDKTASMNAQYETDQYAFYTSTTSIKIYIETLSAAKQDYKAYAELLKGYGYGDTSSALGLAYFRLDGDDESYVSITDMDSMTEANYRGYIQLRFNVYSSAYGHTTPTKTTDEVTLSSITATGMTTTYNVGDTFSFDGTVTATYSNTTSKIVTPTSVSSPDMSTAGYKTVTVTYTENGVTRSFEYTITVIGVAQSYSLAIDSSLTNGVITLISPTEPGLVKTGDRVEFAVKANSGYAVEKVGILEDSSFDIASGAGYFYFTMPEHSVTITATFTEDSGSDIPSDDKFVLSIAVSNMTTVYTVGDTFSFDGKCVATYKDGSTKEVTPTSVSSPDMATAGMKTVTVTYTEGTLSREVKYSITVNPKASSNEYVGVYNDTASTSTYKRAITLSEDGTGNYTYRQSSSFGDYTYVANFTWSVSGSTITFTLVNFNGYTTYNKFGSYRMFTAGDEGTTATGTISSTSISIQLYDALNEASSGPSTFTK